MLDSKTALNLILANKNGGKKKYFGFEK